MNTHAIAESPKLYAHIGGALYLFIILAGIYGELYVRSNLIVAGNPAATAHKIIASDFLFRTGIVGDLLMHLCDLPLMLIFYVLLKPVSKDLSLLAAIFSFLQTSVLVANKLNLVAVLLVHGNPALVSLFLELHEYGFAIGLMFFGVSCLIAGYLLYQSTYFPKALGILQAIAGLCYLINSFALLLAPAFAAKLFPAILLPAFLGELATGLWFLVMGLNVSKWNHYVHRNP